MEQVYVRETTPGKKIVARYHQFTCPGCGKETLELFPDTKLCIGGSYRCIQCSTLLAIRIDN